MALAVTGLDSRGSPGCVQREGQRVAFGASLSGNSTAFQDLSSPGKFVSGSPPSLCSTFFLPFFLPNY